jgi:hypothetical protein
MTPTIATWTLILVVVTPSLNASLNVAIYIIGMPVYSIIHNAFVATNTERTARVPCRAPCQALLLLLLAQMTAPSRAPSRAPLLPVKTVLIRAPCQVRLLQFKTVRTRAPSPALLQPVSTVLIRAQGQALLLLLLAQTTAPSRAPSQASSRAPNQASSQAPLLHIKTRAAMPPVMSVRVHAVETGQIPLLH